MRKCFRNIGISLKTEKTQQVWFSFKFSLSFTVRCQIIGIFIANKIKFEIHIEYLKNKIFTNGHLK